MELSEKPIVPRPETPFNSYCAADCFGQVCWQVELFFRLLKSVLGCRHLLSDSIEGVGIQVYCALIASLLLAEYTGVKPSKRLYELFALYLQGWGDDDELADALARLTRQEKKRDV